MRGLSLFFFIFFAPVFLSAHPHVWIDQSITVEIEKDSLKGFWVEWHFDEMMSAMVSADFDANQDGVLSDKESQGVEINYFQNLSNYHYYCYAWINRGSVPGTRSVPISVESFHASLKKGRLIYKFFVPLRFKLPISGAELVVSIYDESFYTDIGFVEKNPVSVISSPNWNPAWKLWQNKARAYYGGSAVPEEAIIKIKPQKS